MNERENGGIFDGIIEGSSVNQANNNTVLPNTNTEIMGFNMPNYVEPQPTSINNNVLENKVNEVIGFEQPVEMTPVVDMPVQSALVQNIEPSYNDNVIMDYSAPKPSVEMVSHNPVSNDIIDYAVPAPESIVDYNIVQNNSSEVIGFDNNIVPVETINNAEVISDYNSGFVEQPVEVIPVADMPVQSVPVQPIEPSYNDNVITDYTMPQNTVEIVDDTSTSNGASGFNYDFNFENQVQHIEPVTYSETPYVAQPEVIMDNNTLVSEVSASEVINFTDNVAPQVEQSFSSAEVISDYNNGFVEQPVEMTPVDLSVQPSYNDNVIMDYIMPQSNVEVVQPEMIIDNNIDVISGNTEIMDTQLVQDNVETMSVNSDGSIINPNIIVNPIIQNLNTGPEILDMPVEEPRVNYEKIANKKKMVFLGVFFGLLLLFILFLPKIMELFG